MIQVKNVSKEFVSAKKYPGLKGALKGLVSREKVRKTAVDDISFHIKKGEIVGYIGSNGAGKSTTIKMMTGIVHPSSGSIKVAGLDPTKQRKQMAYKINDDCISCGACAGACPVNAIAEGDGKYVIDADTCIECGACADACPVSAPEQE